MNAYTDLYLKTSTSNTICQKCCDIMYYFSDMFNMSYEAFNILCLYCIQPLIYIGLLSTQLMVIYKYTKSKIWLYLLSISVGYIMILFRNLNTDWTNLGTEKIQNIYDLAQEVGLSYSELNLFMFVFCFLMVIFMHIIFIIGNVKIKMFITILYIIISPYLIFVFYT